MKLLLALFVIVSGVCMYQTFSLPVLRLIENMPAEMELPKNFRTARYPYSRSDLNPPSRVGLDSLPLSGSSQFSEPSLKRMIDHLNAEKLFIVDLRQEAHGYVNEKAFSWYSLPHNWGNIDLTPSQVEEDQEKKLSDLSREKKIPLFCKRCWTASWIPVLSVSSEAQVAKALGVNYKRFYVTDHCRPSDAMVDEFVSFVWSLPTNSWLHVHCAAGKGRSTTFMSLYDMMYNASKVSFEDILERQKLIGGSNLLSVGVNSWKTELKIERLAFLKEFYLYCRLNPDFTISWTSWITSKHQNTP